MRDLVDPHSRVDAEGIEPPRLFDWVEDARIRGEIGAYACDPLPIPGRKRGIVFDEVALPFVQAGAPVDAQIEAKKRCGNRTHPRMHPSRFVQLTNAGVDERIARAPFAPRVEPRMRAREMELAHLLLQRFARGVRIVPG